MTDLLIATTPAKGKAFAWPIPPYFKLAEKLSAEHSRDCVVEQIDGVALHGALLGFEPDSGYIRLRPTGVALAQDMGLEQVRMIKLTRKFALVPDVAVTNALGVDNAGIPDEVSFNATFNDGSTFTGRTRGFVKNGSGTYLFLVHNDTKQAVGCFIPEQQITDLQIGPTLGSTLAASKAISSKTLAAALAKQTTLREERLGTFLADRAIMTAADLEHALEHQRHAPTMKLGKFLIDAGLITPVQLDNALNAQRQNRRRRLGDILIEMGAVTSHTVQNALSRKLGIPIVNVSEFVIEPAVLRLLPKAIAVRQQVLPLLRIAESLVVAVEDPLSNDPTQVQFITNLLLIPVIADPAELRTRIALEYSGTNDVPADALHGRRAEPRAGKQLHDSEPAQFHVDALENEFARSGSNAPKEGEDDARVTDNPLVRLVNKIIIDAHAQGASDIHIESNPGKAATRIRFRKDGDLEDYLELQPAFRSALVSRIKIMAGLDISEHRHAQDGKINFGRFGPLPIELRVAVLPTTNQLEDVVLRLLGGVELLPLDKLGLLDHDMSRIKAMITRSYGLILVCGPTGSGKTTTLHSVLQLINRPDLKIWTAEDPVEITQPGLRQVQINARIDWTFATAMRAFLRADPDVIMVGEMRDVETTKIGIEASLTGHLVFSTLHTNSAAESVVRLLDLGMDSFNFSDALIGILSQRLARKLCTHCRKPHTASETELAELAHEYCVDTPLNSADELRRWREHYSTQGSIILYEAAGCDRCSHGYHGRIGIYELLSGSTKVKTLIRTRGTVPQLVAAAVEDGMKLLRQDAIEKVLRGLIDLASARAAST